MAPMTALLAQFREVSEPARRFERLIRRFADLPHEALRVSTTANADQTLDPGAATGFFAAFRSAQNAVPGTDRMAALLARFHDQIAAEPALRLHAVEPLDISKGRLLFREFDASYRRAREVAADKPPSMNVWKHVGIGRREVKHCGVLAWLLDPEGDHCQGMRFLRCLQAEVAPGILPTFEHDEEPRVRTEQWADDSNRVDIEIVGRRSALVIEAKIDTPANLRQLETYWGLAQRLFRTKVLYCVFLTLDGKTPEGEHGFKGLRWGEVAAALRHFADESGGDPLAARDPLIRVLATQYSEYVHQMLEESGYGSATE